MPRIRTIKPEFWGDEKLSLLTAIDRLVFLGLISMADDAGRLVDNVKTIDGFVFPNTDESSRDSLETLARAERIHRYVSDSGQALIQIANWLKHQKVVHPSPYVLPGPRESLARVSGPDLRPTTNDPDPDPDQRSTTNDQRPAAAAAGVERSDRNGKHTPVEPPLSGASTESGADPATVLVSAANRGITECFGEQPAPLRASAGTSLRAVEELRAAGVPVPFARDVIYSAAKRLTLDRPPGSLRYFVQGTIDQWSLERQIRVSAALPAPRQREISRNGSPSGADPDVWKQAAAEIEADEAKRGRKHG